MERLALKSHNAKQRKQRVRAKVIGTTERPRLSVRISNRHITAQLIDDSVHKTLGEVTTVKQPVTGSLAEKAVWVGEEVAKKAKSLKIKQVMFDRGSARYHTRLQALAEAARKEGLDF